MNLTTPSLSSYTPDGVPGILSHRPFASNVDLTHHLVWRTSGRPVHLERRAALGHEVADVANESEQASVAARDLDHPFDVKTRVT